LPTGPGSLDIVAGKVMDERQVQRRRKDDLPRHLRAALPGRVQAPLRESGQCAGVGHTRLGDEVLPVAPRIQSLCTQDRKSTRLNSSHVKISYAVFCLKKKKTNKNNAIQIS